MSTLILENIVKEYRNQTVLNGATLQVSRGERLGLIGPNGCGKTTLLKIAMGLEIPDQGSIITAKQSKIGYLSQTLSEFSASSSTSQTALDYEKVLEVERKMRELEKEMENAASSTEADRTNDLLKKYSKLVTQYESMDGYTIEAKIKSILLGLGLREEALTLPIERLSGGEKMRVALARLLLEEPDLLILDEPTNHLDIDATEWLENFLRKFTGGVLLVSHDRYFLDQVATRIAELENGTITEKAGGYSTYMEEKQKRLDFIRKEQRRLKREVREANLLSQKLRSMSNIKAAKSREKAAKRLQDQLEKKLDAAHSEHLHSIHQPKLAFSRPRHVSAEIAKAENLWKSFGNVTIFSGADFLIRGGERIGIIGPNGCGKTTLLNILLGTEKVTQGLARLGPWVKYGYLGQEILFEDEDRTILQELMALKEFLEKEAREYLSQYQFYGDTVDKKISVLSGGERVRLFLACMMLTEPNCIIMDEPTNHLDVPARDALEAALLDFGGTVIAISHDRYFLNRCISRILEIKDGKILSYSGNYDAYRRAKEKESSQRTEKISETARIRPAPSLSEQEAAEEERKSLEARITELEESLKALEGSFSSDTPYQKYEEYKILLSQLDVLYASWDELAE